MIVVDECRRKDQHDWMKPSVTQNQPGVAAKIASRKAGEGRLGQALRH